MSSDDGKTQAHVESLAQLPHISPMIRPMESRTQSSPESDSHSGSEHDPRRSRAPSLDYKTALTPLPPTPTMGPVNAEITQEQIASVRSGEVLSRTMALKEDHFPFHAGSSLSIRMTGAPNFRGTDLARIYGVGQPTVAGVRSVLNYLGAGRRQGQRPVIWVNLREEPVVYLNQRPFVLRNVEQPFRNITEYAGISCDRIEALEWRLKEEIIREADKCRGNVAVLDEMRHHRAAHAWEPVVEDEVLTPLEVARLLRMHGYNMTYNRVPMTPERAPEPSQLGAIYDIVNAADPATAIVFNCQTGRARTTAAMISACIVQRTNRLLPRLPRAPALGDAAMDKRRPDTDEAETTEAQFWLASLRRGEYLLVRQLLQWLPQEGGKHKDTVDRLAAVCGHVLHVVHIIARYRARAEAAGGADEGASFLKRAAVALERYVLLILFSKYARDQRRAREVDPGGEQRRQSFPEWLARHPDLASIAGTLEGDKAVTALDMGATRLSLSIGKQDATFIANRPGSVLCANAILERDQGSTTHPGATAGAPPPASVREFPQAGPSRVHALGTPNAEGVRAVLYHIRVVAESQVRVPIALARSSSIADVQEVVVDGEAGGDQGAVGTPLRRSTSVPWRAHASGGAPPSGGSAMGEGKPRSFTLWLNLRDTPFVYVKGRPLTVRDAATLFRGASLGAHATAERLEEIEERLKEDVKRELHSGQGRLLIHEMTHDGALSGSWEHVSRSEVLTPREFFTREMELLGSFVYARIPVPRGSDFSPQVLQRLLEQLDRVRHKLRLHIVCSSAAQGGRSALAMLVASLWLRQRDGNVLAADMLPAQRGEGENGASSRPRTPATPQGEPASPREGGDGSVDFTPVLAMQRLLEGCVAARRRVDEVMDSVGRSMHLRSELQALAAQVSNQRTQDSMASTLSRAAIMLKRYMHLVIFQVYLNARGEDRASTRLPSFAEWFRSRRELATLFKEVSAEPAAALRPLGSAFGSEHNVRRRVMSREGRVLGRGSILKFDHFPGCQRKTLEQLVAGAPNFRSVVIDGVTLHVHGTAVPTKDGIVDVLRYLQVLDTPVGDGNGAVEGEYGGEDGADHRFVEDEPSTLGLATQGSEEWSPRERGEPEADRPRTDVLWINLREEPIVYVNGRPFVLRQLHAPTYNVAHSGIATEHVEGMEEGLKEDVEREAEEANGWALLHDENVNYEVLGRDEPVDRGSVETPLELYRSLRARGFGLAYERVPITDEQAPKWEDVDRITQAVLRVPLHGHVVINCQMGRGRTTTGMVIATLVRLWHTRRWGLLDNLRSENSTPVAEREVENEEAGLLAGNFRVIQSLIRVLHGGAEAKARLDAVVDACSAMQNLRETMLRLKRGGEDETVTAQDREHSQELGVHYLRRYFVLICFTGYLMAHEPTSGLSSFTEWMRSHGELQTMLTDIKLE